MSSQSLSGLPSMSAKEAQAAVAKQKALQAEAENPTTSTYYVYADITGGSTTLPAYTGAPVVQPKSDPAPTKYSTWVPPTLGPGLVAYFDNGAWKVGYDIRTLSLAEYKARALHSATENFAIAVENLQSGYHPIERQSWPTQLSDAQALVANGTSSALLSALAEARGMDVKTLASSILNKNVAYSSAYATALAELQQTRDSIESATSVDSLPVLTIQDLDVMNFIPNII